MRLPAVTQKQWYMEDARELHETIWAAYQAGQPHLVPGEPEPFKSRKAASLQGNLHGFWRARGFKLSVTLNAERRIEMAIVPASVKPRRKPSVELDEDDYIWQQPAQRIA